MTPEVLLGHEVPKTIITVYVRRLAGKLAGACLVATSKEMPSLGGFGEVATSPDARRSGIATQLSHQARDDFGERGGQALFLGTGNPDAARIYFRLGWRKLAGRESDGQRTERRLSRRVPCRLLPRHGPGNSERSFSRRPRTDYTSACVSTRLAGAGLQYRNVVHSLRRAGLLPRPVPPVLGFGRGWTGERGSAPVPASGRWLDCRRLGSMAMGNAGWMVSRTGITWDHGRL